MLAEEPPELRKGLLQIPVTRVVAPKAAKAAIVATRGIVDERATQTRAARVEGRKWRMKDRTTYMERKSN